MLKKILIALVSTSFLSVSVFARPPVICSTDPNYNSVAKVIRAVSQTGINDEQTRKIAEGIVEYQTITEKLQEVAIFPLDSVVNGEFDEKVYINATKEKFTEMLAAKATLYKYVFSILNKEQRKKFKEEYAKIK
jgi:hypothetical protein